MDEDRDHGQVFDIPDLWRLPTFFKGADRDDGALFSHVKLNDFKENLFESVVESVVESPPKPAQDGFFALPSLLPLGLPEPNPAPAETLEPEQPEIDVAPKEPEESPWNCWSLSGETPIQEARFQSWDAFDRPDFEEPCTAYLAEADPSIFDAALADDKDMLKLGETGYKILETPVFASSLLSLGLGRNSLLFSWDEANGSFVYNMSPVRISGCTGKSVEDLVSVFMECGNVIKGLQSYVDGTYSKSASPARIALADSVATLLQAVQAQLSIPEKYLNSVLQLEFKFKPALTVLHCFRDIVKTVSRGDTDEIIISKLFKEIQKYEHRSEGLRDILLEVLTRVSQPWLDFASEWIGLRPETGIPVSKAGGGKSFVKVEDKTWLDEQGMDMHELDFVFDPEGIPSLFSPEEAHAIFETGKSLRYLLFHHPTHPLCQSQFVAASNPPPLAWEFVWSDIEQVEKKAKRYEQDLLSALEQYSTAPDKSSKPIVEDALQDCQLDFFGKPPGEMEAHLLTSIKSLSQSLVDHSTTDPLSTLLRQYISGTISATSDTISSSPPLSLVPSLCFGPTIATQARLINSTCMRLFFHSHKLRTHLSLQHSFQLLSNGVFSSRLSHALFDPDFATSERQVGIARTGSTMGLRLGTRESWPPASSELRLALMGLLSDSYVPLTSSSPRNIKDKAKIDKNAGGNDGNGNYQHAKPSLPGALSFAVRDMDPDEIEAIIAPDSLGALDFLRLSYKPPAPLDAIITPLSLFKYDQLFKLLLRVLRMLFVTNQLFRSATSRSSDTDFFADPIARKMRIEMHHFIGCISSYFIENGIQTTWRVFERKLDEVEARIGTASGSTTGAATTSATEGEYGIVQLGENEGLDALREYHEKVLDRIMFCLLLRKRQVPVMKLLEEIFQLVLGFAKAAREGAPKGNVKEMYGAWRKKVGVFVTVLRGLSERRGFGETKRGEEPGVTVGGRRGGLFGGNELVEDAGGANCFAQLLLELEMSGYYSRHS